jgi:hypothetical protein
VSKARLACAVEKKRRKVSLRGKKKQARYKMGKEGKTPKKDKKDKTPSKEKKEKGEDGEEELTELRQVCAIAKPLADIGFHKKILKVVKKGESWKTMKTQNAPLPERKGDTLGYLNRDTGLELTHLISPPHSSYSLQAQAGEARREGGGQGAAQGHQGVSRWRKTPDWISPAHDIKNLLVDSFLCANINQRSRLSFSRCIGRGGARARLLSTHNTPSDDAVFPPSLFFRLCVIAGDISPIDVITHVPILCEEAGVPYIYVHSKVGQYKSNPARDPSRTVVQSFELELLFVCTSL